MENVPRAEAIVLLRNNKKNYKYLLGRLILEPPSYRVYLKIKSKFVFQNIIY